MGCLCTYLAFSRLVVEAMGVEVTTHFGRCDVS